MYKMYYNSNKTSRRCVVANRPRKRNKENGVGMQWRGVGGWCGVGDAIFSIGVLG